MSPTWQSLTLLLQASQFGCSVCMSEGGWGWGVTQHADPVTRAHWGINGGGGKGVVRGSALPVLCESLGVRAKREGAYLSHLDLPPFVRHGWMAPASHVEGGESHPAHVEQGGTERGHTRAMRHQG